MCERKSKQMPGILIVDDDRRILFAIKGRLNAQGYRCLVCSNASEALAAFTHGDIGLVITDLTMPEMDGLSVIALIRASSAIPIIVMTGHITDYEDEIHQYNPVTMIRKPFEMRVLIEQVEMAMSSIGNQVVI